MQYDDTNRGALFKNDRKEKDSHPDYRGTINIDGQEFWLSAWVKKAASGASFMSLSVQPKEAQQTSQQGGGHQQTRSAPRQQSRQQAPQRQQSRPMNDMDDDIPF